MTDPAKPEDNRAFDLKRARAFQDMIKTEGWKMYQDLLNTLINEKGLRLMDKLPAELNAVERQEHEKGAMNGLILARDIPSLTIKTMEAFKTSDPAGEN